MDRKLLLERMAQTMYSECVDFCHRYADKISLRPLPWSELKSGDRTYWLEQAECAARFVMSNWEDFADVMLPALVV